MKKPKRLRSRCAAEDCRKVFRHADRRAATCSKSCKMRVYRARQKARQAFAREQEEAASQAQWDRARAFMQAKARRQVESNRQPPPAPASAPRPPAPPAAPVRRHSEIPPLDLPERTVVIRLPKRPPMTRL